MGKPAPLIHSEGTGVDHDAVLASEQEAYLQANPSIQFVVSCIEIIRKYNPVWLTPVMLRLRYPSKRRMEWLKDRPDIRQLITMTNCGLGKNSARVLGTDYQATLLDSAVDNDDITIQQYENGFNARDLACYGDAADWYVFMVESLPWDLDVDQAFVGDLIKEALEPRGTHPSVLTHLQVRRAINGLVWQDKIPDDILAKIDEDRHDLEELDPAKPFTAKDEFERATPQLIAKSIPLIELKPIFLLAMKVMGFVPEPKSEESSASASANTTGATATDMTPEPLVGAPTMHAPPTTELEHNRPTALLPGSVEEAVNHPEPKTDSTDMDGDASIESNEVDVSEVAHMLPRSDLPPPPSQDEESKKTSEIDKTVEDGVASLVALESKDTETPSDPPSSSHKPEGTLSRRERLAAEKKKSPVSPPPLPNKREP